MNTNKYFSDKLKSSKEDYKARLKMLHETALQKLNHSIDLQKYIPPDLQNFCNIIATNPKKITLHVYPAIYLRQLQAQKQQIIDNIRKDFPDDFAELCEFDMKVRPLATKKNTAVAKGKNTTEIAKDTNPKKQDKPDSIKKMLLNIAEKTTDPELKQQLIKMSRGN